MPVSRGNVASPMSHGWQERDEDMPAVRENVPAGQPWHLVRPVPYEPRLHALHTPEHELQGSPMAVEHRPRLQVRCAGNVAVGQYRHALEPISGA